MQLQLWAEETSLNWGVQESGSLHNVLKLTRMGFKSPGSLVITTDINNYCSYLLLSPMAMSFLTSALSKMTGGGKDHLIFF